MTPAHRPRKHHHHHAGQKNLEKLSTDFDKTIEKAKEIVEKIVREEVKYSWPR